VQNKQTLMSASGVKEGGPHHGAEEKLMADIKQERILILSTMSTIKLAIHKELGDLQTDLRGN
jgi:hypothetical protein